MDTVRERTRGSGMIELFEQNTRTLARQSSKGKQLKWENDGIWYKADYTGYEGLADCNIGTALSECVWGEPEPVVYHRRSIPE